jgi:FemAB-related protein (PEP-CTERM system-associated)
MSAAVRVAGLVPQACAAWDAFVSVAPEATFFHRAGWAQVIERAFGHRAHYLYAEEQGRITGVLPLVELRSLLFGHALVSTPFCVYGGVAATSAAARAALTEAACALARELGVHYLELRHRTAQNPHWPTKGLYVTFRRPIEGDDERNFAAIPRKQRAMVRKGIDAGLVAEPDTGVDRLHACYAESVRNLGTPVFARRYLETLREVFGPDCEVLVVRHAGTPVAAVMSFYFRDEVLPYYGGGSERARELKANDFMYWEVMRRAAARGARLYDYGRSKVDTGSYSFKKHWGFEPQPLHYEYHLVKARSMPDLSPKNPKYRVFIAGWKRLPLPVAARVGPWLARSLG